MTLYRATFFAQYLGLTHQNVVHFEALVGQGQPPPSTAVIAQDLAANWIQIEQTLHQSSFKWTAIAVSEIRNPAPMAAHLEPLNFPGAGVTESHSVSCFKLRWQTNRGGRRGFGKYYIGGINWALVEGGNNLSQTARDRLNTMAAGIGARYMQVDQAIVPFHMVLVHKDVNDAPNDIVSAEFYPNLGVQRRRGRGVGI